MPSPEPAPLRTRLAGARRPTGVALAALAAVVIGVVTLTPQPVGHAVAFGPTCLVCGEMGGADVIANVLLFLPLGAGLALAGLPWRRALLAGALVSLGIETVQLLAIPGRYATLSDVLTNTTGAALGAALAAHRRAWLRPGPRTAPRLVLLAAAAFVGALAFGAWGLGTAEDHDDAPPRADRIPLPTGLGWFAGEVRRATIDGVAFTNRGTGPITVAAPARQRSRVAVDFRGWDRRAELVPMLYVHRPAETESWLALGQEGWLLVVEPAYRGRLLRLRRPRIGIDAPKGWRWRGRRDSTFTLRADVSSDRVSIEVAQGGWHNLNIVRMSPTSGWALLSPLPRVDTPIANLATAAWVAGLALPLGYWTRWLARRRRGEVAAATGMLATFAAGLVGIPAAAGFAPARPWEWIAACGGALLGAGLAEVVRRGALSRRPA